MYRLYSRTCIYLLVTTSPSKLRQLWFPCVQRERRSVGDILTTELVYTLVALSRWEVLNPNSVTTWKEVWDSISMILNYQRLLIFVKIWRCVPLILSIQSSKGVSGQSLRFPSPPQTLLPKSDHCPINRLCLVQIVKVGLMFEALESLL